jgi:triosephosphate isomerase (TIM)
MKYVIANWKMNLSVRESIALTRGVLRTIQGKENLPCIVVCPSATALAEVHKLVTRTHLTLGAQNVGPERAGAYTGEIGTAQLEDLGCGYVVLGHSERRQHFGETDEVVRQRLMAVSASKMTPVVCVGEPAEVRRTGKAESYVLDQLKAALSDVKFSRQHTLIVAYEPVWAIGTGEAATPEQVVAMHTAIRHYLVRGLGREAATVAVVYGGSIQGDNAYQFLREQEVDGVLVGGASLNVTEFTKILEAAWEVMQAQASV